MKVLVCAPCSCSLCVCVCVYVLDGLTLSAGRRTANSRWAGKKRYTRWKWKELRKCGKHRTGGLPPPLTHTQTNKQHRETGHGCSLKAAAAAAAQQTQPWPTLRSKGSNGSSKKFSKAKRCGNATGLFSLLLSSFFKIVSALLKYTLPAAVIVTK